MFMDTMYFPYVRRIAEASFADLGHDCREDGLELKPRKPPKSPPPA